MSRSTRCVCLHRQKPGNGAAGVSTRVAPETVGSLTSRDLRVDGNPVRGELKVRRSAWLEVSGKVIRSASGTPGDWLERTNSIHDMLGPVLEGVDLRMPGRGRILYGEPAPFARL